MNFSSIQLNTVSRSKSAKVTCIRPMSTAQTLSRKIPKGTPGKEAIKEN